MFDRSCSCCLSDFSFICFCFVSMLAMKTLPVDLLNFPAMETLDAIFIEVGVAQKGRGDSTRSATYGQGGWQTCYARLKNRPPPNVNMAVTLSLGGKRKLGYTNGNSVCPDSKDPKYEDWIANDQLVRSWILNSMEPHIVEIFTFSNFSKELWDSISELYGRNNNSAGVFKLKCEIVVAEQGDKTFSEHLGYLKKLWDELNMYRPFTADLIVL
ncbi:hypothetical protein WN944_001861 [Citrus x changshan-huyou]|uniref:Retrotransposon Copia-like N-terminal domain-containing protein n=1 Tax=Citrus x changshan-huyou TaxID=2935761 RepID=A0AAP0MHE6_9ROSI